MSRMGLSRRARVALVLVGAVFAALLAGVGLLSTTSAAIVTTTSTLNPGKIGTVGTDVTENCNQGPGWIFVLPAAGGDAFWTITLTFKDAGTVSGHVQSNPKFADVQVSLSDTLLGGTAQVIGGGPGSQFTLTHVCGTGLTTTTTGPTTTTSTSSSTTTTSPTTSTSTSTSTTSSSTSTTSTSTSTSTTSTSTSTTEPTSSTTTTTEEPTSTTTTSIGGDTSTTSTSIEGETSTTSTTIENQGSTTSTSVEGGTSTTIENDGSTTTTEPVGPAGSTTPTTASGTSGASATSGTLPFTGSDGPFTAAFGAALVIAGGILVRTARTRRR